MTRSIDQIQKDIAVQIDHLGSQADLRERDLIMREISRLQGEMALAKLASKRKRGHIPPEVL